MKSYMVIRMTITPICLHFFVVVICLHIIYSIDICSKKFLINRCCLKIISYFK